MCVGCVLGVCVLGLCVCVCWVCGCVWVGVSVCGCVLVFGCGVCVFCADIPDFVASCSDRILNIVALLINL